MTIKNRINREASGFLNLFRAKVGGQGPLTILEQVQPTVDVTPFLGAGILRCDHVTNTGNPPSNINIEVPATEVWMIHSVTGSLHQESVGATGAATWQIQLQGLVDQNGSITDGTIGQATMTSDPGALKGTGASAIWQPGTSVILPSSARVQFQFVRDDFTNSYTVDLAVVYTSLGT